MKTNVKQEVYVLVIEDWNLFDYWPACAKPLRRRQVLGVW